MSTQRYEGKASTGDSINIRQVGATFPGLLRCGLFNASVPVGIAEESDQGRSVLPIFQVEPQ